MPWTGGEQFFAFCFKVTRFIADGGLVMMLIDPPSKKVSGSRSDFGSVLSDSLCSISERFSNEQSDISWLWSVRSPFHHPEGDLPSGNQTTRMLIGSGSDGRQHVVCFVAMLVRLFLNKMNF